MPAESQEKPPLQPAPHDGEDLRWEEEHSGGKTRGRTVKHCLLPEDSDEEEVPARKKLKW